MEANFGANAGGHAPSHSEVKLQTGFIQGDDGLFFEPALASECKTSEMHESNESNDVSMDATWNDIVCNELTFLMKKQFSMEDQRKKYQMPYCC